MSWLRRIVGRPEPPDPVLATLIKPARKIFEGYDQSKHAASVKRQQQAERVRKRSAAIALGEPKGKAQRSRVSPFRRRA